MRLEADPPKDAAGVTTSSGRRTAATILAVAVLVGACGGRTEPPTSTPAPTATGTTAPGPSPTLPAFPPERDELEHGALTWAVILAGADDAADPAIVEAERAATDAGYTTGWTDCDEGAAEALGLTGYTITTSVYFDTREDAQAAAAAFEARGVDGVVAEVRTMCLD